LASGYRIVTAADDAAGLAVSERMRTQSRGLAQARLNIQDAISLVQTGEAGMHEIHAMLQRMRVLAVQAANETLTDADRRLLQEEVTNLVEEIDRLASGTVFNTMRILRATGGEFVWIPEVPAPVPARRFTFHVGANKGEVIRVPIPRVSTTTLLVEGLSITTRTAAEAAISTLDIAVNRLSGWRAGLGAAQNRLEHTLNATGIAFESISAAESRIRDLDFAAEMMEFTKRQILVQAGVAMLAQANMLPQTVLALIG
jgi:flagellin